VSSLGLQELIILTNNPNKVSALKSAGIQVKQQQLEVFSNKFNEKYLATKEEKLGHTRGVR
jgi:3,4-dihydroxy 2-butanone 4-phosphate synthase/GTP cyclohydrolase II